MVFKYYKIWLFDDEKWNEYIRFKNDENWYPTTPEACISGTCIVEPIDWSKIWFLNIK